MPSTIDEAFVRFLSNLEIPTIDPEKISARQRGICEVLQQKIMIVNDFVSGSYARSTMIAPLQDAEIDLFVVLESHYFHHFNSKRRGHAQLLNMVQWALRQTYRAPVVNRNGRAVTVWFNDVGVCVVPVMLRLDDGYVIPSARTQSWISTNPKKHDQALHEANRVHHQMLVPLIKMIKAWNRGSGSFFTSFHLEVLALKALKGITISDFPSGIRLFFDKARDAIAVRTLDPAGYGNDIGDYIETPAEITEATKRLSAAYEAALRAEQQGALCERTAIDLWRQLFPAYFPG